MKKKLRAQNEIIFIGPIATNNGQSKQKSGKFNFSLKNN